MFIKVIDLKTNQPVQYRPWHKFNPWMTILSSSDNVHWSMAPVEDMWAATDVTQ